MIELTAVIEAGVKLQCWTKAIQSVSKLGEHVTVELSGTQIVLSAFNSSRSVFHSAKFPLSFFRGYRYGRQIRQARRRDNKVSIGSRLATASSTSFQLQSKALVTIFKKVEKDAHKIHQIKLVLIDERTNEEIDDDQLGRASCLEFKIDTSKKISKSYRIPCLNAHQDTHYSALDTTACPYSFIFDARTLKKYMDHMSMKAEEFSFTFEGENVSLVSRTQGVTSAHEVLKNPIHTEVRTRYDDMDYAKVMLGHSIAIRTREFRGFVQAASEFNGGVVRAVYQDPKFPVIFFIEGPSIFKEVELQGVFLSSGETFQVEGDGEPEVIQVDNRARLVGHVDNAMPTQYTTQTQNPQTDHSRELTADRELPSGAPDGSLFVQSNHDDDDHDEPQEIRWDEHQELTSTVAQDQYPDFEIEENELDRELEVRSQINASQLGPTQNKSQARGLFDDPDASL